MEVMIGMSQETLDNKKGHWQEYDYPGDPNFIELDVDEEIIIRYVATEKNPDRENSLIHTFQFLNGDEDIKKMYGKTNLDNWLTLFKPGDILRIKRFDDIQVGKPKPKQIYKVWRWEAD